MGPLDEALATWREISFARRKWPSTMAKPRGFQRAAELIASNAPLGYSEWHRLRTFRSRQEVMATIASLIAGRAMTSCRWGRIQDTESALVPRYWVGRPAVKAG